MEKEDWEILRQDEKRGFGRRSTGGVGLPWALYGKQAAATWSLQAYLKETQQHCESD